MTKPSSRPGLLRPRGDDVEARVSNVELFFDLVFVYAITQISHSLLKDLTLQGALHNGLLFLAVWWVWIFTSWVTNWLDPDRAPVRIALFALMLAGLVLSMSIPQAFGPRGLAFAGAYVFMQVGRSAFTLWALGSGEPEHTRNFQRILCWLAFSALFWITGGLLEGPARLALWCIALLLDYISPSLGFQVPGLGRSSTTDWNVDGSHLAERCSLFIIIALGESLLVTGATFEQLTADLLNSAAFAIAFLNSVAMWWIYFDTGAERGAHRISHAGDPGALARLAYTYIHLLIVAGIILSAVADELLLAHPLGHSEPATLLVMLGGPLLYVIGNALFKLAFSGRPPLSHLIGIALLALLALAAPMLQPLSLYTLATAIIVLVAVWETLSLRGGKPNGDAPPI